VSDDTTLPAQAGSDARVAGGSSLTTGGGVLGMPPPLSGPGTALGLQVGVWTPIAIWIPSVDRAGGYGPLPSNWRDLPAAPYGAAEASALHRRGLLMMAQRRRPDDMLELVVQPSREGIAEAQVSAARDRMMNKVA
jgi:hypothetical protein